jgi:hypothetical protein
MMMNDGSRRGNKLQTEYDVQVSTVLYSMKRKAMLKNQSSEKRKAKVRLCSDRFHKILLTFQSAKFAKSNLPT